MNIYELFLQVLQNHSMNDVSIATGVNKNTLKLWQSNQKVPEHYINDFHRMLGMECIGVDQFYTRPETALKCWEIFNHHMDMLGINIDDYAFIEPSAGNGSFYGILPKNRRIGLDIEPHGDGIIKQDYLTYIPQNEKYIVIGNPPFGMRGHMALQFMNHSQFADVVAFILPQMFDSDGKGSPSKRVDPMLKLVHSERLPEDSFMDTCGNHMAISTIFQIRSRIHHDRIITRHRRTCRKYIKVYSLSNGGTPATTRNKDMIGKCDLYLPSTCFDGMQLYDNFESLPQGRGFGIVVVSSQKEVKRALWATSWEQMAFRSTNGALNLRTSIIEDAVVNAGFYD